MTLAIRLCVCIRSQYDAVHMPGKPSVMSDSGNILMTMTNTQEPQNTNTSGALAVAKAAAGLKLYDTASHAVSSFTPIKPGQVGIYVCGATVQSSPHIGHIRAAVSVGKPLLGVCLGHQIIATALGAKLKKGSEPEIGFAPIKRIDKHDYFSMWNKTLDVLHWHNDVVTLPEGAQPLAKSAKTKNQAFRFGSALGLQFHLEVTPTLLDEWLDEPCMVKDLKAAGGSKSQLRDAFAEYNPQLQPMADQVFSGFAARCSTYAATLER